MSTLARYPVLRCGRYSLVHPHQVQLCPRCGAANPVLVEIDRRELITAAVDFLVPAEEIALPYAMAARLRALAQQAHSLVSDWQARVVARR